MPTYDGIRRKSHDESGDSKSRVCVTAANCARDAMRPCPGLEGTRLCMRFGDILYALGTKSDLFSAAVIK
jgi:hypothetical protein